MVFNRATKKLLERAGNLNVVLHDWWLYQLVSAADGAVHYDRQAALKYRQHQQSLIGSNLGLRARLIRIRLMLNGRFRDWNAINIAALESVPADIISPKNRTILSLFTKATSSTLLWRLIYYKKSGVYRQSVLDNIGLFLAAAFKRL